MREQGAREGYRSLMLLTRRGPVEARLYPASGAAAVILVGGVGGGFDSPARDLYATLGGELPARGIAVLRLQYRDPTDLEGATYDVRAGIAHLEGLGARRIGLVGHSLGGAVVIRAAAGSLSVSGVVTLASQSYGADEVGALSPRALLLLHGLADEVLPAYCSAQLFKRAREPKQLRLLEGAGHVLDEAAGEVHREVREWLVHHLGAEGGPR